ncbi:MAG: ECF-type sigma factor [Planctomycetaceae bacterium]|nr:ECF-type sigma factor [Planctomycetaceae bacterium]
MSSDVTQILLDVTKGNRERVDELLKILHSDLKAAASSALRGERAGHTLHPTALLNEVYLQFINQTRVDWKNRSHFCAVASTLMRRILVDHAREKNAQKRGGGAVIQPLLSDPIAEDPTDELDLVALDGLLTELAELNDRHARVIELRFFGGMSIEETAHVLDVSAWTVKNDWRTARAWLLAQLDGDQQ